MTPSAVYSKRLLANAEGRFDQDIGEDEDNHGEDPLLAAATSAHHVSTEHNPHVRHGCSIPTVFGLNHSYSLLDFTAHILFLNLSHSLTNTFSHPSSVTQTHTPSLTHSHPLLLTHSHPLHLLFSFLFFVAAINVSSQQLFLSSVHPSA